MFDPRRTGAISYESWVTRQIESYSSGKPALKACKVVRQIETPRLPDPIMRRPCADREEKRVTDANEPARRNCAGQLDLKHPNQRGFSIDLDQ
jgi:hypothetical protein